MRTLYLANVTVHVLAALVWLGGMFFVAVVGAPVLRRVESPALRSELFRELGERFRAVGWACIALLVATGTLRAQQLPDAPVARALQQPIHETANERIESRLPTLQQFYEARGYRPVWTDSLGLTLHGYRLVTALAVCDLLDHNTDKSLADLKNALPKTWGSPTMSPHCADEAKYGIVEKITAEYEAAAGAGSAVAGQRIRDLVTVNGVRVVLEDGTWGLVRASSNKPELVIVVESPVSEANMRAIFADIDGRLAKHPEVGEYNQKI